MSLSASVASEAPLLQTFTNDYAAILLRTVTLLDSRNHAN